MRAFVQDVSRRYQSRRTRRRSKSMTSRWRCRSASIGCMNWSLLVLALLSSLSRFDKSLVKAGTDLGEETKTEKRKIQDERRTVRKVGRSWEQLAEQDILQRRYLSHLRARREAEFHLFEDAAESDAAVRRALVDWKVGTNGREFAVGVASKVHYDFYDRYDFVRTSGDSTIVVDVTRSAFLQLLANDNITDVEYDSIWTEQVSHKSVRVPSGNGGSSGSRGSGGSLPVSVVQDSVWLVVNSSHSSSLSAGTIATNNSSGVVFGNSSSTAGSESALTLASPLSLLRRKGNRENENEQVPYGISMVQADKLGYNTQHKSMVCIVDSGASNLHPDLDILNIQGANRGSLEWDFDRLGHGTHVAGTVAAKAYNNYGVRGISGSIPLYITRGLDDEGNGRESDIRDAIEQCVAAGARVVSLSISGPFMSNSMKSFFDRTYRDHNILFVAAAGNSGKKVYEYPSSFASVVSVSAVNSDEAFWLGGSNYNSAIELSAPGVNVLSTTIVKSAFSGQLRQQQHFTFSFFSGTSMATPHVSGVAALLWSHFPSCSNTQIRVAMARSAKDKGIRGCDEYYGYGIVQAYSAFQFLQKNSCTSSSNQWGRNVGNGKCSLS